MSLEERVVKRHSDFEARFAEMDKQVCEYVGQLENKSFHNS